MPWHLLALLSARFFIYPSTVSSPVKPCEYSETTLTNNIHIFLLATQRKMCYLTWPDTPENNAGKNAQIGFRAE